MLRDEEKMLRRGDFDTTLETKGPKIRKIGGTAPGTIDIGISCGSEPISSIRI